MTKKEMFAHIATVNSEDAEIVAFCNHEIELLNKKKGGDSTKPTQNQKANAEFKKAILATLEEKGVPMTISELMKECKAIAGLTNQRTTAIVTQLKASGEVVRTFDKRKAFFGLPEEEESDGLAQASKELEE